MSREVDERVVSMQIENKEFSKGVDKSIDDIDRLEKKLDFEGAAKGLENLTKAISNIDFSAISRGAETMKTKLSLATMASIAVVERLTNKVIDAASAMVRSLTITPVSDGWNKYEMKMGAVQTIMSSTGESLQTVNDKLAELNRYSDQTIYSFADMTQNIGKFTNAGVKLDKAVAAIKGISNEAALSGANANEAARAMYNFAQALSSGAVRLIDWKSIENANMATVEFKNELIKTAVELGVLKETADGYVSTTTDMQGKVSDAFTATHAFNDSLSHQWMTSEVLIGTLEKYASEQTDIGKRALSAAQDIKTFSQMISVLREAVSTGWTTSWEIMFGDFEEAKKLWTGVSKVLSDMITQMTNARNEMLRGGLSSGWKQVTNEVTTDANMLQTVIRKVASRSIEDFDEMIDAAGGFEESLKTGWLTSNMLMDAINTVYKDATTMSKEQLEAAGYTDQFIKEVLTLKAKVDSGIVSVKDLAEQLSKTSGRENFVQAATNAFEGLLSILRPIKQAFTDLFPKATGDTIYNLSVALKDLTANMKISEGSAKTLYTIARAIFTPLHAIVTVIKIAAKLFGIAVVAGWKLIDFLVSLPSSAGKATKTIENMGIWTQKLGGLFSALSAAGKNLSSIFTGLAKVAGQFAASIATNTINLAAGAFDTLGKALEPIGDILINSVTKGLNYIANIKINSLADIGKIFTDSIGSAFNTIIELAKAVKDAIGIVFGAFTGVGGQAANGGMAAVVTTVDQFSDAASGAGTVITNIKGFIKGLFEAFEQLNLRLTATRILIYAFGVATVKVTLNIGKLIGEAANFVEGLAGVAKNFGALLVQFKQDFHGISKGLVSVLKSLSSRIRPNRITEIAIAIGILAASLAVLSQIDQTKLINGGTALVAAATALAIFTGIMTAIASTVAKSKETMAALNSVVIMLGVTTASIMGLVMALMMLSTVDTQNISDQLASMLVFLVEIAAFITVISMSTKSFDKGAGTIVAFALSFVVIIGAFKSLSNMNFSGILQNFSAMFAAAIILKKIAKSTSKGDIKGAGATLLMIIAFEGLILEMQQLAHMDGTAILKGILALLPLVISVNLLMKATTKAGPNAAAAGGAIALISAAMLLLVPALQGLGSIELNILVKGMAVVAALIALFTAFTVLQKAQPGIVGGAGAIVMFSSAILLLQFAIAYLGSLDIKQVTVGTLAVGALIMFFALFTRLAGYVRGSVPVILAMTGAIGLLAVALTLMSQIPETEILAAAASLSGTMVALGLLCQYLDDLKFGKALGNTIALGIIIAALVGAMVAMDKVAAGGDPTRLVAYAGALSMFILAITASTKLVSTIDASCVNSAAIMALFVGEAALGIMALAGIDPIGGIAAAASLSIALMSIAAASNLIKTSNFAEALPMATLMGVLVLACSAALNNLREMNPEAAIPIATALSEVMLAMAGVTAILSKVGSGSLAPAIEGAASMVAIVGIMSLLIDALGGLMNMGLLSSGNMEQGIAVLQNIGSAIGGFIGGIVGGIVGGIAGGFMSQIVTIAQSLTSFSNALQPFLDSIGAIPAGTFESIKSLADAIIALNGITEALPIIGEEGKMAKLGIELSAFAPAFVLFCKTIEAGNINTEVVEAATNCAVALSGLASNLPSSGGKLQEWFGEKDLGQFGLQLVAFGNALVMYSRTLSVEGAFDAKVVKDSADAAKGLTTLASNLPSTGGKLNEWFFGTKDLSVFGSQLESFGDSIVKYYKAISTEGAFDAAAVTESANAIALLQDMASNLPSSGGKIAEWLFGKKDMGLFGEQLSALGTGIAGYYTALKDAGFNADAVTQSVTALEMLAGIYDLLPESGSVVQKLFTGDKDLSGFGDALKAIGDGLSEFYKSVSSIGETPEALNSLAQAHVAGADIAKAIIEGFQGSAQQFQDAGKSAVGDFTYGISSNVGDTKEAAKSLATEAQTQLKTALDVVGKSSNKFEDIGKYCVAGFAKGLKNDSNGDVKTSATDLGNAAYNATAKAAGVESPSVLFAEIGKYCAQGLANGMRDNSSTAEDSAVKMGENVIDAMQNSLGINSPSTVARDEVGRYIVQGISEGITSDMSAEDAAAKKAENIINAFKSQLDSLDLNDATSDLEYKLWQGLNPNADQAEATERANKNFEDKLASQAERVKISQAEYKATLMALGEESAKTKEAYNSYLQEQIDMTDLANQYLQSQQQTSKDIEAVATDTFAAYNDFLRESKQSLLDAGFSEDEIKKYARTKTGFDPATFGMKDTGANSVQGIIERFMGQVQESAEHIDSDVEVILADKLNTGIKKAIASVSKGQGNSGDEGQDVPVDGSAIDYSAWFESIKSGFSDDKEFNDIGKNAVTGIANGINSVVDRVSDGASNIFNKLVGNDGGLKDQLKEGSPSKVMYDVGMFAVEGFANGLSDPISVGNVTTSATNIGTGCVDAFHDMEPQWEDVGKYSVDGFINGMNSKLQEAAQTAANIAYQAYLEAMKALGIASPSKKFYEIGKFVDLGFTNGLTDYASRVTNASVKVGDDSINAMNDAIQRASDIANGMSSDIMPTIVPVLDTTEIQRGLGVIDTMLASNRASVTAGVVAEADAYKRSSQNGGNLQGSEQQGATYTFNQYNTSPKALSRLDIYRQSKNLFAQTKEVGNRNALRSNRH